MGTPLHVTRRFEFSLDCKWYIKYSHCYLDIISSFVTMVVPSCYLDYLGLERGEGLVEEETLFPLDRT